MRNDTPRSFVGTTTFEVRGMTCGHCVQSVTAEVGSVPGVSDVQVDLPSGTVTVTVDMPVDRADVVAAVRDAGYSVVG